MFNRFRPLLGVKTRGLSSLKSMNAPVFIRSAPGSRSLELAHPDEGNIITDDTLKILANNLEKIEENHTVAVVFLGSRCPDKFSQGLARSSLGVSKEVVKAANSLSLAISALNKDSIAVYSGTFDDTAYSTFAASKYRLGTTSTRMTMNIFKHGRLHVGGGLPFFFAKAPNGHAHLRFLSVVPRLLNAYDMFALGLLSHVVEEDPQSTLMYTLGCTLGPRDNIKAVQTAGVDASSLGELLDTMHMLDDETTTPEEGSLETDEVWDKVMLIPPTREEPIEEGFVTVPELADKDRLAQVEHCFGAESVEECRQRLTIVANTVAGSEWATEALNNMKSLHENDLKEWFRLTELASKVTLASQLEEEELSHAKIVDSL